MNPEYSDRRSERIWFLGSACLYGGIGIFALAVIDGVATLPFPMPDIWYANRLMWPFLAIIAFVTGMRLVRFEQRMTWRPTRAGRRFGTMVLYTRQNCGLCDEAKQLLRAYSVWLPDLVEVDIDDDPQFLEQFDTCVPVVQIDARVRFRGRVQETLLRRLIEGTAPGTTREKSISRGCGSGSCGNSSSSNDGKKGRCKSASCESGNCSS